MRSARFINAGENFSGSNPTQPTTTTTGCWRSEPALSDSIPTSQNPLARCSISSYSCLLGLVLGITACKGLHDQQDGSSGNARQLGRLTDGQNPSDPHQTPPQPDQTPAICRTQKAAKRMDQKAAKGMDDRGRLTPSGWSLTAHSCVCVCERETETERQTETGAMPNENCIEWGQWACEQAYAMHNTRHCFLPSNAPAF